MTMDMPKFYSLEEIAQQLGVTYQLVYKLVRTGELPSVRIGKVYRITDLDLETYLIRQRDKVQKSIVSQTCSRCGKTFFSSQSLTGKCEECGAPLCIHCQSVDHAHYCKEHEHFHDMIPLVTASERQELIKQKTQA